MHLSLRAASTWPCIHQVEHGCWGSHHRECPAPAWTSAAQGPSPGQPCPCPPSASASFYSSRRGRPRTAAGPAPPGVRWLQAAAASPGGPPSRLRPQLGRTVWDNLLAQVCDVIHLHMFCWFKTSSRLLIRGQPRLRMRGQVMDVAGGRCCACCTPQRLLDDEVFGWVPAPAAV